MEPTPAPSACGGGAEACGPGSPGEPRSKVENDLEGARSIGASGGGGSTADEAGGGLEPTGTLPLPLLTLLLLIGECDICCQGATLTVGVCGPCGALLSRKGMAPLPEGGYAGLAQPCVAPRPRTGDCDLWPMDFVVGFRGVTLPCGVTLRDMG
mmetsp:Transcript_71261/g.202011  ORF Transcript_71261/g.202011 Transcript_71261/m.202011 type:complete len:154 (+) Transcript_71261:1128-1589(+)